MYMHTYTHIQRSVLYAHTEKDLVNIGTASSSLTVSPDSSYMKGMGTSISLRMTQVKKDSQMSAPFWFLMESSLFPRARELNMKGMGTSISLRMTQVDIPKRQPRFQF